MNLYACINIRVPVNTWKNSDTDLTEKFVTEPGINVSVILPEIIIWPGVSMAVPEEILSDDLTLFYVYEYIHISIHNRM